MPIWKSGTYRARGRLKSRVNQVRQTKQERARSIQRLREALQEQAKQLRQCDHKNSYIKLVLADGVTDDTYDQDTKEKRCLGCGRLLEDLS